MARTARSDRPATCEYLLRDAVDVGLYRASDPAFAVEGEGGPQIRVGVLLRGVIQTETPMGLLINDAREAPRAFVLPANVSYAITAIPGHAPVIFGAMFGGDTFERYVEEAARPGSRAPAAPMALPDPVAALGLEAFHRSLWSGADSLEWESLLVTSLRRLFPAPDSVRRPSSSAEPRGVARVREYLHAHCHESIPLEHLAAIAGVSKFHLIRAFRAAVGVPPHTYQLRLRLGRSLFLLRQAMPLSAVAYELGFSDQSHFTRAFRAEFGTTPGAWLRSLGRPAAPEPISQRGRRTPGAGAQPVISATG